MTAELQTKPFVVQNIEELRLYGMGLNKKRR